MSNRWVRHSRAHGNPLVSVPASWIPADAGMTDEARWVCPNSIGDGYNSLLVIRHSSWVVNDE